MLHSALAMQTTDGAATAFSFSLPGKSLRCAEGFEFRQIDADTVMLMQCDQPGPLLKCGCNAPGCGLQLNPEDRRTVLALESVCHGNWGWSVRIPGMTPTFMLLAMQP